MTYAELTKKLISCGCSFDRQAKGSHEIWHSRVTSQRTTISRHGNMDLAPGTVSGIIRDLGIDKKDFDKA